jgi:hypothetical protein
VYLRSDHSGQETDADHCLVVAKVRQRLAVGKQRSHRFHMETFRLKTVMRQRANSSIVFRSQMGLQLRKIWMQRWKLIELGKLLERVSKFEPKRV